MLCLKKGWARVAILKLRGDFIFQLQDVEELSQTKNNESNSSPPGTRRTQRK